MDNDLDMGNGGVAAVESAIASIAGKPGIETDVRKMNGPDAAYAAWVRDKTPENMSGVLSALAPTINSEVTRYPGPSTLLRSKARVLAVNAVKTFNPMSGAKLNSWVVTNLKQLARYSVKQRDVSIPEVAARQAAAVDAATRSLSDELGRDPTDAELADELGISEKRVRNVRSKAVASVNSGRFDEIEGEEDSSMVPGVVTPSNVPFAQEAVYMGLSDQDKLVFDAATGSHGVGMIPAQEVARRLGISPAAVSQRAKAIADQIAYVAENG